MPREIHKFRDYLITLDVFNFTREERQEAIDFWLQEKAIAVEKTEQRSKELVAVAKNKKGNVVGVYTVTPGTVHTFTAPYYYLRTYIGRADRITGLYPEISILVKPYLQHNGDPKFAGIYAVMENKNHGYRAARRLLVNAGWQHLGEDAKKLDVWIYHFADHEDSK